VWLYKVSVRLACIVLLLKNLKMPVLTHQYLLKIALTLVGVQCGTIVHVCSLNLLKKCAPFVYKDLNVIQRF
jgi:hypothetical protein